MIHDRITRDKQNLILTLTLTLTLIKVLNNLNPHRISSSDNGLTNTLNGNMLITRILLLDLGNLINMLERNRRRNSVSWAGASTLNTSGILEVPRHSRRLNDEFEGVVFVSSNGDRHWSVWLVLLGSSIEVFTEGHQV
uniref:Uncharacterized protein n=1 Tax=Opuntia streptacantha TaxID=393608 RepID=A0A7C8Z187_OPUST